MITEENVIQLQELCRKITMDSFSKKKNKGYYLIGEKMELKQVFSEFASGILQIVLGDQSLAIEGFIDGNAELLSNRFKNK